MPPATSVVVSLEPADTPDASELLQMLDDEMRRLYPAESIHAFAPEQAVGRRGAFAVARLDDGQAVACGAVRSLDEAVGEVKRVFVAVPFRRRGIARLLMRALEQAAVERGFHCLRLETGTRQPDALALYRALGYHEIPLFGEYVADPFSVCLEKHLAVEA